MINHLLLIDDDPTTLKLLTLMVRRHNFADNVIVLPNGKEGLDYFEKLHLGEISSVPELIFLDVEMPVMNGWDFLEEYTLRYEHLFPHTRICICSFSFLPFDTERIRRYPSVLSYIRKPLVIEEITKLKEHESLKQHFALS